MLATKHRAAIVAFILAAPAFGQGVPTGGGTIHKIAEMQSLVADLCVTNPGICSEDGN